MAGLSRALERAIVRNQGGLALDHDHGRVRLLTRRVAGYILRVSFACNYYHLKRLGSRMLLHLPTKAIILILEHADYCSILSCGAVSVQLLDYVFLQYLTLAYDRHAKD